MAYNNIDQAVTFQPNNQLANFAQQMYDDNRRNKYIQAQQAKEDQQRQEAMTKYVGGIFHDKNNFTGTGYDPMIINKSADYVNKISKLIRDGGNSADVQLFTTQGAADIAQTSATIKNIKANVEKQSAAFGKMQGVDANALSQLAISNAFYKTDANGRRVLKDIKDVDPDADYVSDAIMNHPELIAKGDSGFRNYLKGFQLSKIGNSDQFEKDGVTRKQVYSLEKPDFMEEVKDKNGWVTGAKVRSENINGVDVADEDVYSAFNTDPSTSIYLQSRFKDYTNKNKLDIDPRSPQADLIKRKILFDELSQKAITKFEKGSTQSNNTLVDKQQMGVPLYRQGLSDGAKLAKGDDKLKNNDAALMLRAMGGDQVVLEGAESKDVGGKTFYDISKSMGGMKLGYDADRKAIYANEVLVDPISKEVSITGTDGKVNTYSGKQVRTLVKRTAEFNGLSLDKADRTLNMYTDKDGAYTGKQDTEGIARAQADREVKAFNARKEVIGVADNFAKSKNVDFLPALKGVTLKDGIIEDAGKQGLFSSGAYFIKINGEKKVFDTAYLLSEYIKNNVK